MFHKREYFIFLGALVLIIAAYLLMAFDPVANGFGTLTLWIAPPVLLVGLLLPVAAITGNTRFNKSAWQSLQGNRIKHMVGLIAFAISLTTYLLTLEPTASLWDCSEFIASAFKLQVPHSPGTPLALLVGRLFSMLSFGDVAHVAWCINFMSALFSALTVWLIYNLVCIFGKVIINGRNVPDQIIFFAAFCGSLCLAFSDTFWFSAVEGETYGIACFFLVLVFWLIVTGKDLQEPARSRRLVLIFYVAGLSFCIHPMCLLTLPVLPFAWCTHGRILKFVNGVVSIASGLAIILFINRFVAVGLFELAFSFDLFFVNQVGLPFYSGAVVLLTLLITVFAWLLSKYPRKAMYLWAVIFFVFGFAPYLVLFIRSNHNPPIDQTNPENLSMIKAYMNRDSYGSRPLLYGPYFDARIQDVSVKKDIYYKSDNTYEVAGTMPEYHYGGRQTILPRMYSNDADHIKIYRHLTGIKDGGKPTFADNLQFMFTYQVGHMYLRYLMWNFAGRESDVQNSPWLNPWEQVGAPDKYNKARNQYWMLPLIFGIAGALFHFRRNRKDFIGSLLFFLITGLVLVLYLNSPPSEPRERDYIYVGSYIAFCIWIGLGFLFLAEVANRIRFGVILAGVIMVSIPLWMLYQNYDDHNRAGRTFQIDNARNILNSCAPHSILFTGGDNDTFSLWYAQEVEGFRTDVRVMVLSYMNTDWYINQLRKGYYDSPAFRLSLDENDYRQYGPNDVLYVHESIKTPIDFTQYLQLLRNEHPALKQLAANGETYHIVPSRTLILDTGEKLRNVGLAADDQAEIVLHVTDNYISKNLLAILDLVISNENKRPVYFNYTSMNTVGIDLSHYLVQEGPVYRLTSTKTADDNIAIDLELSFQNLVRNADYSNLSDSTVHFGYEDYYARMIVPVRQAFNTLALSYLNEGHEKKAEQVLDVAMDKLYHKHLRPSYTNLQAAEILLTLNKKKEAESLTLPAFEYYYSLVNADILKDDKPEELDLYLLRESANMLAAATGDSKYVEIVKTIGLSGDR